MARLEPELLRLERQLQAGSWRRGRYVEIAIRDPKPRLVSAAPFADRVVHHALCAVIGPIFERGFIDDSYANRKGKGTHRAVARYERFRDRFRHVLRCDIYRCFPAIDHAILKQDLRRHLAPARCHLPRRAVRSRPPTLFETGMRPSVRHPDHRGLTGPLSAGACCAAAPGTTNRTTCARPTATGTTPGTGTTTPVFAQPVHPIAGAGPFTDGAGVRGCVQDRS